MLVFSNSHQGKGRAAFSFRPSNPTPFVPFPHSCSEMRHSPIYFWISPLGSRILALPRVLWARPLPMKKGIPEAREKSRIQAGTSASPLGLVLHSVSLASGSISLLIISGEHGEIPRVESLHPNSSVDWPCDLGGLSTSLQTVVQ